MAMGIHEICLAGTCCYCRQAIKLRGMSGGGLGPQWDGGWQADLEPGDRSAWAGYCVARTDLAAARGRTATGLGHRPDRASIQVRSAHDEPVAEAEGIGVTRYAVMKKPPVSLFFPAGLLITGVPAGIELEEVQAELDTVLRRGRGGAVGFFADDPEVGLRHEIFAGNEPRFAGIREDQVRAVDWERLVAAAQGRRALIRYDWQDLRTGGLAGLARKARAHQTAAADRKRRIRELSWSLAGRLAD